MAKKPETEAVETVETGATANVYFKESILKSKRYANRRDALTFLLKDGESYTFEQVDEILDNFMKGQVK